jgi:hypothetical protein
MRTLLTSLINKTRIANAAINQTSNQTVMIRKKQMLHNLVLKEWYLLKAGPDLVNIMVKPDQLHSYSSSC